MHSILVSISTTSCLQDDLLYESLTVYETLYYAAMLRLPQHMDHAAKIDRIDSVITALGLVSCKDTIIGEQSQSLSHVVLQGVFSWAADVGNTGLTFVLWQWPLRCSLYLHMSWLFVGAAQLPRAVRHQPFLLFMPLLSPSLLRSMAF